MTAPSIHTAPGLVDLQVNGYAGFDFNAPASDWTAEQLHRIRNALARRGICVVLPTLITDDPGAIFARAKQYAELVEADRELAATFPKLHVEGPFISPADGPRGAHPKAYCKLPSEMPDFLKALREASADRIGIFTLAPELPGGLELIRRLGEAGICPAIGHTQASSEILAEAVSAGAKLSTHLGNGSHNMLPRLDNYVQAQLADDRLVASFIADGHHIPLTTLKNFLRAKTPVRSCLISDAIAAAEMPPGEYEVGGQLVIVHPDGRCSQPHAKHLAGSALTLDRAILNVFAHCDVSFEQAWAMASTQPAELIGLPSPEPITVEITDSGFLRR